MQNRLWETFRDLAAIDSVSRAERKFCDELKSRLTALGIAHCEDGADAQIGGDCGNLYAYLPGDTRAPILLSAHMDTVEPGSGKRAILRDDGKITSAGDTILGADDVSGVAVILETITRLQERGEAHRPIELLFSAAEELYCIGSAAAEFDRITSREAYVLDLSGDIGTAANAAPTILAFTITIRGKAAHSGFAPQDGINAIAAAANAISRTPQGEIARAENTSVTCNVGTITGGSASNIISDYCRVTGEIRSLSHKAATAQWETVRAIFAEEAEKLGATAEFEHIFQLIAYETSLDSVTVQHFRAACEKTGVPCEIAPTLGGSDNNSFAQHGIEGLVIACAMHEVHTTREHTNLAELEKCVELVLNLLTQ
jgi:tripeptide aminopeptidase